MSPDTVSVVKAALLLYSAKLHEQFGDDFHICERAREVHAVWAKIAPQALTVEGKLHPLVDKNT